MKEYQSHFYGAVTREESALEIQGRVKSTSSVQGVTANGAILEKAELKVVKESEW